VIGLAYLLPLCLAVSLVYEATHGEDMAAIFSKGLKLFVMLSGGIIGLAVLMFLFGKFL
jgi:hypothetical protein